MASIRWKYYFEKRTQRVYYCPGTFGNHARCKLLAGDNVVTGIIDGYHNLSQLGESKIEQGGYAGENAFVAEHAVVLAGGVAKGKARIFGDAVVAGRVQAYCQVSGEAYIGKKAQLGQIIDAESSVWDGRIAASEYCRIFSGLLTGNVLVAGNATIGEPEDEESDEPPDNFAHIIGHSRDYTDNGDLIFRSGYVRIYGESHIGSTAHISGFARISGKAQVYGTVRGNARVYGNAIIEQGAIVEGNARVAGDAIIPKGTTVRGNARVTGCPKITIGTAGELVLDENAILSTLSIVDVGLGQRVTITDQSALPYNCANLAEYGGNIFSRSASYSDDKPDTGTKASNGCGRVKVLFLETLQLDDEILITGDKDFLEKLNAVD